jgi:hypothetical protein
MDRTAAVIPAGRVLTFVIVALPLALLPATCPGESGGDFGMLGPVVWLELLAAGLLAGAMLRGWSGAMIVAGGVAAGVCVFAATAQLTGTHQGCGRLADPEYLLNVLILVIVPGFLAVVLIGYGIVRSAARSAGDGGWLPLVSPGRLLVLVGALAWLLAQFLPAWTYTSLGDTITEAGITFTVWPLAQALAGTGYFIAWAANLLLAGAWWLAVERAAFGRASLLSVVATACAVAGVAIQLDEGSNNEVVKTGTFVWCASFAVLALGLAVRRFATWRNEPAHAGQRHGVPVPDDIDRAAGAGSTAQFPEFSGPATPQSYSEKYSGTEWASTPAIPSPGAGQGGGLVDRLTAVRYADTLVIIGFGVWIVALFLPAISWTGWNAGTRQPIAFLSLGYGSGAEPSSAYPGPLTLLPAVVLIVIALFARLDGRRATVLFSAFLAAFLAAFWATDVAVNTKSVSEAYVLGVRLSSDFGHVTVHPWIWLVPCGLLLIAIGWTAWAHRSGHSDLPVPAPGTTPNLPTDRSQPV